MSPLFRRAAAIAVVGVGGVAAVAAYAASRNDGVPSAKQQIVDKEAAARASAWRAPKSALSAPRADQVQPPRQAGIVDMHQGPFSGSEFAVRNMWQGPVGGRWLLVYAGGRRGSDGRVTRGGVRVYTEPIDPDDGADLTLLGEYDTKTPDALAVSAVKGGAASLRTDSGKSLTLSLTTGAFAGTGR